MDADYNRCGKPVPAGSVVANRLSAGSVRRGSVVLEGGPAGQGQVHPHPRRPFAKLFRGDMDWHYMTEPQKGNSTGARSIWPRGKMLGGSSSMNAMMWVRGFAADYDEWAEQAGEQWELRHQRRGILQTASRTAPLVISRPQRSPRSSTAAWLTAVPECPRRNPKAFFAKHPRPHSAGERGGAQLTHTSKPALRRPNLTLYTEASATTG